MKIKLIKTKFSILLLMALYIDKIEYEDFSLFYNYSIVNKVH